MQGLTKQHPGDFAATKGDKYDVHRFKLTHKLVIPWDANGVLDPPPDERKMRRKRNVTKTKKKATRF